MPRLFLFTSAAALSLLAACGSGGTASDAITITAGDTVETLAAKLSDARPDFADGSRDIENALFAENGDPDGLFGFISDGSGGVVPLSVQVNTARDAASVTLGDAAPILLSNASIGPASIFFSGDGTSILFDYSGLSGSLDLSQSGAGTLTALLGLMTPVDALPETSVRYTGSYDMDAGDRFGGGALDLTVDFGTGGITGETQATLTTARFFAPLEGRLVGSTFAVRGDTSGDVAGTLVFVGGHYPGDELIGAVGGTLDDLPVRGTFQISN